MRRLVGVLASFSSIMEAQTRRPEVADAPPAVFTSLPEPSRESDIPARWLLGGLLAITALVYVFIIFASSVVIGGTRYFVLGDDAMISMRYAWQMAHGHGLVWNPGDRVEGISNLGWTLVMVGVHWLHLPLRLNSLVVELLNLGLHLGLVACVFSYLRPRSGLAIAFWSAFLVGFSLPLLHWASSGFETALQTLLITGALLRLLPFGKASEAEREPRLYLVPLLCALAFVVRPDSIVFVMVGSVAAWMCLPPASSPMRKQEQARLLLALLAASALVASVLFWQKAYYGDWLPNTFYLKAEGGARSLKRGLAYLRHFAVDDWQGLYLLGWIGYVGRGLVRRENLVRVLAVGATVGVWLLYLIAIGGDAFPRSRFFTPILPLLIVCTVRFVLERYPGRMAFALTPPETWQITVRLPRYAWKITALLSILLLAQLLTMIRPLIESKSLLKRGARSNVLTALGLQSMNLPDRSVIGVFWAGGTPYFLPNQRFHDLLGKSDAHIAHVQALWGQPGHNKWDYDYSLGVVRPDYVITVTPLNQSEAELRQTLDAREDNSYHAAFVLHPLFQRDYAPHRVPIRVNNEEPAIHWVFARR